MVFEGVWWAGNPCSDAVFILGASSPGSLAVEADTGAGSLSLGAANDTFSVDAVTTGAAVSGNWPAARRAASAQANAFPEGVRGVAAFSPSVDSTNSRRPSTAASALASVCSGGVRSTHEPA
eukprot:scaffold185970_cov26-Tisochrysis_lutea.AAC.2